MSDKTKIRSGDTTLTLLLLFLSLVPPLARAQFTFTTNNGTITLTRYTGAGGDVVVPNTTNGLPVTSLQSSVFSFNGTITSVAIPDTITNIDWMSFNGCSALTAINIDPNNPAYSSVGGALFDRNQTMLIEYPGAGPTTFVIPAGVLSIQDVAFSASDIVNLTLPDGVTSIGEEAFESCSSLAAINLPNSITNISPYAFSWCTSLTNITLPNGITGVVPGAFQDCHSLTQVLIPDSVSNIDQFAFDDCYSLISVTLPTSLTNIGMGAFGNCRSLLAIVFPNSLTKIPENGFVNCSNLTDVTISSSITNIGNYAFAGCGKLTAINVDALNSIYSSVDGVLFDKNQTTLLEYPAGKAGNYVIPNTVNRLGDGAFLNCFRLTGVDIPNTVTSFGGGVFQGCLNLTSVILPDSITTLEGMTFFGCRSLTNVVIPNSVTSIAGDVFYGITNLKSITIPSSVTQITGPAFEYSSGLTAVYFEGNAPALNFSNPNFLFYHDDNVIVYYLPGTAGWDATFEGRPTALWHPQVQSTGSSFGVQSNQFGFNINWASGQTVVVEATTNLTNPAWFRVSTNTLTGSAAYFIDPQWTNYPNRFYRIRSP